MKSENIANARLIASAPALLEALEIARSWLADANQPDFCPACEADNPGHDMVCPIPIIEEAIAKARGDEANAEFMVLACNSHDALLTAIQEVLYAYEDDSDTDLAIKLELPMENLQTAIDKAKGGETTKICT